MYNNITNFSISFKYTKLNTKKKNLKLYFNDNYIIFYE